MSQATLSSGPYLNSNLFSGYYLDERIDGLDAWDHDRQASVAFDELRELWREEANLVASYKEDELLDSWIDEVLDVLGFGTLSETTLPGGGGYNDRLLFGSTDERREAAFEKKDGRQEAMYDLASALLEAKQWDASFTDRFDEQRSYRDASHQIKYYLERTPEHLQWGVLTNGRKWRLYGSKDYETQTYYEVDLPELLESNDLDAFKYFYLFFRPEAFREIENTTFLDTVWNESETAAQELGEDLQNNVFTALRVLGKGFVETNDLDIDPDDDIRLDALKEQSLVLLYRLMFILYAESRHLIDPDDPGSRSEYDENFSLDTLRLEILDTVGNAPSENAFDAEYSEYATRMWGRLENLFALIDSGNESLGIPPYNGGLFDENQHAFLSENEVADRYLAEVIYRLSTTETDGGFVPADYADLDTRHLGTIYEGLLEHEFRIAPTRYAAVSEDGGQVWKDATEVSVADSAGRGPGGNRNAGRSGDAVETVDAGGLYVVNDDDERKATGAYYTPDYVVTYIVEETVDPLIEDIDADLTERGLERGTQEYVFRFADDVLGLKVLDPAMGSGHFLTKATGYLAEQVMERVRELETATLFDEQEIRRRVSRECIYGVDLNGMAVELAKLSMWLETLATDQPLAFLDHHLKTGNSLVGSDITEILATEDDGPTGQTRLTDWMTQTRKRALEHVMELVQDLLAVDNETLSDIKSMEEIYAEIRADPLYQHLFEMASVHTAAQFGLDVPDDADERMAMALRDDSWERIEEETWYRDAQRHASASRYFHWELEFPEVFFGEDGSKMEDAGFDAVVGNPPYVRIQELRTNVPQQAEYLTKYESARGNFDLYVNFTEVGYELLSDYGFLGYIEPHKFFQSDFGRGIREYLAKKDALEKILSFEHGQVFANASVYTCVLILSTKARDGHSYAEISPTALENGIKPNYREINTVIGGDPWVFKSPEVLQILSKIEEQPLRLAEVTEKIYQGVITSADDVYLVNEIEGGGDVTVVEDKDGKRHEIESQLLYPFLKGQDVKRYAPLNPPQSVILPYRRRGDDLEFIDERSLKSDFPRTHSYFKSHELDLRSRDSGSMDTERWYDFTRAQNMSEFLSQKLVTPEISYGGNFTYDTIGMLHKSKVYGVVTTDSFGERYLLTLLNSRLLWFYLQSTGYVLRGGYFTFKTDYLEPFCLPTTEATAQLSPNQDDLDTANEIIEDINVANLSSKNPNTLECLKTLAETQLYLVSKFDSLNLSLLDHLGNYADGPTLMDIGITQPAEGVRSSIISETAETKPNLRIGDATVERESPNTVVVRLTARYKPEGDDHETDRWGYTETEPLPALRITDLEEREADLIEAFVPVAVDEAGGFANFRDTATKTNSLVNRLEKLTLPDVGDVEDGLANYIETKEWAEELDEKIERTDALIDDIVYELYGLTEEEIEIVEAATDG